MACEEMVIWNRAYRKAFGTRPDPISSDLDKDVDEPTIEEDWEDDGFTENEH